MLIFRWEVMIEKYDMKVFLCGQLFEFLEKSQGFILKNFCGGNEDKEDNERNKEREKERKEGSVLMGCIFWKSKDFDVYL